MVGSPKPDKPNAMHLITLISLIFLSACNSQDIRQSSASFNKNSDQLNPTVDSKGFTQFSNGRHSKRTPPKIKQLQSTGTTIEKLIIRWPRLEPLNPFSSDSIRYEIWHNDIHIDTISTNSYLLPVNLDKSQIGNNANYNCIRLRAVKIDQKSELSEPTCYAVN